MKYLTSAIVAGMLIASPAAAQKIGVASDSEVIQPAPVAAGAGGGLLGGSLGGAAVAGIVGLAAIVAIAAAGNGSSSSTPNTPPAAQ